MAQRGGRRVSAQTFTILDVFEEIDHVVYTFQDEKALAAWSLHGTETYTSVRPADPGDAIDPAELYALLGAHRAKPPATRFNVVA